MKVAVIVVNWNSGGYLKRCLESLYRQTTKPAEIVVVDNASKDGSIEIVEQCFHDIQLIKLRKNVGFAAANNIAVEAVRECDWIATLNPDAFPTATWIAEMAKAVKEYKEYTFFGCRLVQAAHQERLDGTGDIYHVSGLAWRRDHKQEAKKIDRASGEVFAPCAAAALYNRKAFLGAGGFDKSFFCYFEDIDLGFRLRLLGHRCMYIATAVVEHIGSGTTGERSDFAVYHGHRNLVWAYVKNMPGLLFWLYLPQHILMNLITMIWYSSHGKGRVILSAKWDALRGLPRAWGQRRKIQAERKIAALHLRKTMAKGWNRPYWRRYV